MHLSKIDFDLMFSFSQYNEVSRNVAYLHKKYASATKM